MSSQEVSAVPPCLPSDSAVARLTIPVRSEYTQACLAFAENLAEQLGFLQSEQRHIRLGLEEIIAYLMQAALSGGDHEPITLTFEPQADGLLIRVVEKGLPLDITAMPEYTPDKLEPDSELDGLSLFLARQVMDRVLFRNRGREGMEIELLKRQANRHIQARMEVGEQQPDLSASSTLAEPTPYSIRPARADEAIEVSRCAFLTYGYTYEDFIYYPERIAEMNATGALRSLVAVSDSGTILGHCALKCAADHANRAELGVLFVRPEYRRQGVGVALWGACVEMGRKMGLNSLFARSVTGHRASQAMAVHYGFQDCALFLAQFPRAVQLKSLGGQQPGKMSGMMQWLGLRSARERCLDAPARHGSMIAQLYRRSGIPFRMDPSSLQPSDTARTTMFRVPVLNIAIMEVSAIGGDVAAICDWARHHLRRCCAEKLDAIYLSLTLEETGAAAVAEECASMGFLFAGIAPDIFQGRDALVMQYLNLPDDPFESMTVWTDTAALLRDYIADEWKASQERTFGSP